MKRTNKNILRTDSDSTSNCGAKSKSVETMDCINKNNYEIINRVWIVKKSIALGDIGEPFPFNIFSLIDTTPEKIMFEKIKALEIKNETKCRFKHWATILELSNGTYVNIQFGDKGFSLKEFNKTNIEGESVLDAIVETWGYTDHPFSFCYLGRANYEYEKLKEKLREIKNEELKRYKDKGSVYYHLVNRNCQHFACDLERILFGSIQLWHSFDYYLQDFYKAFFSEINIDVLKRQLQNKIDTMS